MPSSGTTCAALACSSFAISVAALLMGAYGVRLNITPSMPLGLYILDEPKAASLVTFCAPPLTDGQTIYSRGYSGAGRCPDGGAPLLKPIAARVGDIVTVTASGVSINGAVLTNSTIHPRDAEGRAMPQYPHGTYSVPEGYVWAISDYNAGSIDSRYFGPVAVSSIREYVRPLLTWPALATRS